MQLIVALLLFYTFLLGVALFYNAPVLLIVVAARRRLPRNVARGLVAAGFAAAAAFMIWRMEWFDVWRHGRPPLSYVLKAFVPETAAMALTGWGLASLLVRRARAFPPRDKSRPQVDPGATLC